MTTTPRAYIGTSGWNYDHWRGIFYPKGLPSSCWLRHYSQHFDTVEINFSFYRLPERSTFEKWCDESPEESTLAVRNAKRLIELLDDL